MSTLSQFMTSVPQTVSFNSNDTILSGDLVSLGSDGTLYSVSDPTVTGITSAIRPPFFVNSNIPLIFNPIKTNQAPLSPGSAYATTHAIAVLSNNIIAIASIDATAPYPVVFSLYNGDGTILVDYVQVAASASSSYCGINIVALTGGNFVIAYCDASGVRSHAVYNSAGGLVQAAAAISGSGTPISYSPMLMAALSGGGYVISGLNSAGNFGFAIFSATGTTVKAWIVLATYSYYKLGIGCKNAICALTNGGFAVAWYDTNYQMLCMSVCSATGTIVRAAGTITGATLGASYVSAQISLCALSGGGFVIAYSCYGGACIAGAFNASGVQQGSFINISGDFGSSDNYAFPTIACAGLTSGAAQIIWANCSNWNTYNTSSISTAQISASGALVPNSLLKLEVNRSFMSTVAICATPDGGSIVYYSSATRDNVIKINSSSTAYAPYQQTIVTNGITDLVNLAINSNGLVAKSFQTSGTNSVTIAAYYGNTIGARVPIGVAMNAGNVGQSVKVQISGTAQLRYSFLKTWSANYQTQSPPGQRLSVVGNLVSLYGISGNPSSQVIQIN